MSGLVGKRGLADVPGLGEVNCRKRLGSELGPVPWPPAKRPCCEASVSITARSFSSAAIQRSAQNWHGLGESDCLIKTKHCDGPRGC